MKISSISIACSTALCLANPAFAQTNITLYGLIDTALNVSNQGNGTLTRLQSGSVFGSRWGIRGTEDLGDGMKAIFMLENGFGSDDGSLQQGGRLFGRHAWVGLDSRLGTFTVGRQLSPHFLAFFNIDAFQLGHAAGLPVITRTNAAGAPGFVLGAYLRTSRIDNSLIYVSPNIGGVTARILYGLSESAAGQSAGGSVGSSLQYTKGPFDFNWGYTAAKDTDGFGAFKALSVGGSYVAGNSKIFMGYTRDTNTSADTAVAGGQAVDYKLINLGIRYMVSGTTTLIAQATKLYDRSDNLKTNLDATILGIGFDYNLSKRTTLYASIGTVSNKNGSAYSLGGNLYTGGPAAGDVLAKTITGGIRHTF